ncbi:MAG: PKD domain-containing protein [Rubripirellula sp.]
MRGQLADSSDRGRSRRSRLGIEQLEDRRMLAGGDLLSTLHSGKSDHGFGNAVAIDNGIAAIGAFQDNGAQGSVYLFDLANPSTRIHVPNPAPTGQDGFGYSVAIDNDLLVVGSCCDATGAIGAGRAHVFDIANGQPTFITSIDNPSPDNYDGFGWSVAVEGNTVVVGAPKDSDVRFRTGVAYVFDISSGSAVLTATIPNPTPVIEDRFGEQVRLSNGKIAISAPSSNGQNTTFDPAFTYLYDLSTGNPTLQHTIQRGQSVGTDVSLHDGVLVTASVSSGGEYQLHIYDVNGPQLALRDTVVTPISYGPLIAASVSVADNRLLVGSPYHSSGPRYDGVAFLYDISGTEAALIQVIRNPSSAQSEGFGYAVGVEGERIVITSEFDLDNDTEVETAYVFDASLPEYDFGDAGGTYPTQSSDNGARHLAVGPLLGALRDTEYNGTAVYGGNADDVLGGSNDEDGVTFSLISPGTPSATASVSTTNGPGKLDAWIDFNRDGDWNDTGEQIAASVTVGAVAGTVDQIAFAVPAGSSSGPTMARFRISTLGNLSSTGTADDGEVEDYLVNIAPAPSLAVQSLAVSVNEGNAAQNIGSFDHEINNANVAITASLGSVIQTNGKSGTWAWTYNTSDGPANSTTVSITATDGDGASQTKTFQMTVVNAAPVISMDLDDIALGVGSSAQKSVTVTDVVADSVTVTASIGTITPNGGSAWTWVYDATAALPETTVTINATDKDGAQTTASFQLTVDANAASVSAGGDKTSQEGSPVSFAATYTGPDLSSTATILWTFGDGGTANTLSATHTYADDGAFTATLTVTDGNQTWSDTAQASIANIPATFTPNPDVNIPASGQGSFATSFSFNDPGSDTWTGTVDYGDGSPVETLNINSANRTIDLLHTYTASGTYPVLVKIIDDDSAAGSDFQDTFDVMVTVDGGNQTRDKTTVEVDGSGNLVIDAINQNFDDNLTLSISGDSVVIHDPGILLTSTVPGAIGIDTHTLQIPIQSVTGNVQISTYAGNDTITFDLADSDVEIFAQIDGGSNGSLGDRLVFENGNAFNLVFTYNSETSGSLFLDGFQVSYTAIETIDTDVTVEHILLDYSSASETIFISDLGNGRVELDSTVGAATTMNVPTDTFVINGGAGVDNLDISNINLDDFDLDGVEFNAGPDGGGVLPAGVGRSVDLTNPRTTGILRGIRQINMLGSGANRLVTNRQSVIDVTDSSNVLTVLTDKEDSIAAADMFEIVSTQVIDQVFTVIAQSGTAQLQIVGSDWTNPFVRQDVNGQDGVSAIDALIIINELTRKRFSNADDNGGLSDPASITEFPGFFYDVNSDGRASALDALQVINAIGIVGASGELVAGVSTGYESSIHDFFAQRLRSYRYDEPASRSLIGNLPGRDWVISKADTWVSKSDTPAPVGSEDTNSKIERPDLEDVVVADIVDAALALLDW